MFHFSQVVSMFNNSHYIAIIIFQRLILLLPLRLTAKFSGIKQHICIEFFGILLINRIASICKISYAIFYRRGVSAVCGVKPFDKGSMKELKRFPRFHKQR